VIVHVCGGPLEFNSLRSCTEGLGAKILNRQTFKALPVCELIILTDWQAGGMREVPQMSDDSIVPQLKHR